MKPSVTIVDYGLGNIYSVTRAVEHCGGEAMLTVDPVEIENAQRLILPGVGAFADGMRGLQERQLIEPICRFVAAGRPLLGICLGMQMLATYGEEFGVFKGLNIIPGRVVHIPTSTVTGEILKCPHIGWNELKRTEKADWDSSPLHGLKEGTSVYLVHSYHFVTDDDVNVLAKCEYGGHDITAAVRQGHVTGCQFHPEKSGEAGLAIVRNFLSE